MPSNQVRRIVSPCLAPARQRPTLVGLANVLLSSTAAGDKLDPGRAQSGQIPPPLWAKGHSGILAGKAFCAGQRQWSHRAPCWLCESVQFPHTLAAMLSRSPQRTQMPGGHKQGTVPVIASTAAYSSIAISGLILEVPGVWCTQRRTVWTSRPYGAQKGVV